MCIWKKELQDAAQRVVSLLQDALSQPAPRESEYCCYCHLNIVYKQLFLIFLRWAIFYILCYSNSSLCLNGKFVVLLVSHKEFLQILQTRGILVMTLSRTWQGLWYSGNRAGQCCFLFLLFFHHYNIIFFLCCALNIVCLLMHLTVSSLILLWHFALRKLSSSKVSD